MGREREAQPLSVWHVLVAVVQSLSRVQLFETPWTAACQASLSFAVSQSLLKPMSIESVISSDHLILCHPLLLLPSMFRSIRVFSNALSLRIRWSFSISPSNEYSGLISLRMDWLDLLAFQRKVKSLLQHHSSKASVLGTPSHICTSWTAGSPRSSPGGSWPETVPTRKVRGH